MSSANLSFGDRVIAAALALVFLLLALSSLGTWCYWGDDYAAYISEGIAISEGTLDKQTHLNALMHPSPLPEGTDGSLVYVWGYPLLMSLVYRAVGFDRADYSTLVYYKLPSALSLALIAAVLFLFLRRRFGKKLSLLLTVAFCSCAEFFGFINSLYSDLVFLLLALMSLWLAELFEDEIFLRKKIPLALALGVLLTLTCETRLNGPAILLACAVLQLVSFIKEKKYRRFSLLLIELIPYAVFIVLKLLTERLIACPTSNSGDLGSFESAVLFANLRTYSQLIMSFFGLLWNNLLISPLYSVLRRFVSISYDDLAVLKTVLIWLSAALCVLGVITNGIKRNLHLTLLCVVYIIVASLLPYTQGLRYIYPLLPVLVMFCGYGIRFIGRGRTNEHFILSIAFLWSLVCLYPAYTNAAAAKSGEALRDVPIVNIEDIYMQNAYSDAAVEVYGYIQNETEPECTVAFFAPRGLYLNTERFSIKPDVNGHSIDEADYYLDYLKTGEYDLSPDLKEDFELVFSNEEFNLYQRTAGEQ